MSEHSASESRRQKAHEQVVNCPDCGSTRLKDFNPVMIRVDLLTCCDCGTEFNGHDGSKAPFTVTCSSNHEVPFSNDKCYCGEDLTEAKAALR